MRCVVAYAAALPSLLFPAATAVAQVPALTFSGELLSPAALTSTRGYVFNVTVVEGVAATHLSVYDDGGNGLAEAHPVGLWNTSGVLLASATVPSGTTAPLDASGKFRAVDIPDVLLPQGSNYAVGALFLADSGDKQAFNWTSSATAPGISFVEGRFDSQGGAVLTFPIEPIAVGLPGGSFDVVPVPEPSLPLLAVAACGVAGVRWLRRWATGNRPEGKPA